jgi:hypothetical protein
MYIEWNPEKEFPPKIDGQLGKFLSIKKDVTSLFNSRVKLTALRYLTEDEKKTYDHCFSYDSYKFDGTEHYGIGDFAKELVDDFPNGGDWTVTNATDTREYKIEHSGKPSDVGYSVVFVGCPWDIFVRYWRKPIRFKSKLTFRRYYKKGLPRKTRNPNIDILSFAQNVNDWVKGTRPELKFLQNQILLADFNYAFEKRKRNAVDQEIADWMLQNVSSFKLLTDESTPFCDPATEFCFTSDVFGRYQQRSDD